MNVYLIDIVGVAVASMYAWVGQPTPTVVNLFIGVAPLVAVGSWFRRYLRYAQVTMPYDFGFFYMIAWPVVVPLYARRIYPERRWLSIGRLFGLAFAPTIAELVVGAAAAVTRQTGG